MTLTLTRCRVAESLPQEVKEKSEREFCSRCRGGNAFDPPWDKDMMSEEAKLELGFYKKPKSSLYRIKWLVIII